MFFKSRNIRYCIVVQRNIRQVDELRKRGNILNRIHSRIQNGQFFHARQSGNIRNAVIVYPQPFHILKAAQLGNIAQHIIVQVQPAQFVKLRKR